MSQNGGLFLEMINIGKTITANFMNKRHNISIAIQI